MQIHIVSELQISVWVYKQAIKQKVYTGTVKKDSHKFCHLSYECCNCGMFRIYQKQLFSRGKTEKLELAVFPIYYYLYLCQ